MLFAVACHGVSFGLGSSVRIFLWCEEALLALPGEGDPEAEMLRPGPWWAVASSCSWQTWSRLQRTFPYHSRVSSPPALAIIGRLCRRFRRFRRRLWRGFRNEAS